MEAAIADGHIVAMLTGEDVRPVVELELPSGVELLPARVSAKTFVLRRRGGEAGR